MKASIIKPNKYRNINHDQLKEDNRNTPTKRKQNCEKIHKPVISNKNKLLVKQTLSKSRQKELQNNPDQFIKQIQKTFQSKINQLNKKYLNNDKSKKKCKSLEKTPIQLMKIQFPSYQDNIKSKNTQQVIQIQKQQKIVSSENQMQSSKCTFQKQKQFSLKYSQIQLIHKTCKQQQHLISTKLQSVSQVYEQNQDCIRECFNSIISDIEMIHSNITHLLQEEKQKHLTESKIQSEVYSFITMLKKIKNVHLRQQQYYQDKQQRKSGKQSDHSFVYFTTQAEMEKVLKLHSNGYKLINNVKFIQKQLQNRYDRISQVVGKIKHFLSDISTSRLLIDCLDQQSSSLSEENDFSQNNGCLNQFKNQNLDESQQEIDLEKLSFKIHQNKLYSSPLKIKNPSHTQEIGKIINQHTNTMINSHDLLDHINNAKNITHQHNLRNQCSKKEILKIQSLQLEIFKKNQQGQKQALIELNQDKESISLQKLKNQDILEREIESYDKIQINKQIPKVLENDKTSKQIAGQQIMNRQNNESIYSEFKLQQQFYSQPVVAQQRKQLSQLESSINNEDCLSFPFTAKNRNEFSSQQSKSEIQVKEQNIIRNNKFIEESPRSDLVWMADIQCLVSKDLDHIDNRQQNMFTVDLAQFKSENMVTSPRRRCQNNQYIQMGPEITCSQLQITPTKSLEGNTKRSIKKYNSILKNSKHHNQNQIKQRNLIRINQNALTLPRIANAENEQQSTQQDHSKSIKKLRTYRKINPYLLFNSSIDQITKKVATQQNVFNLASKQTHHSVTKSKSIDFIHSYKSLEQLPSHLKQIQDLRFTKEISDSRNLSAVVLPLNFNPDTAFQSNSHRQFFNQMSSSRKSAKNNCYDTLKKQKLKFDKIKNCRFTTFGLQV